MGPVTPQTGRHRATIPGLTPWQAPDNYGRCRPAALPKELEPERAVVPTENPNCDKVQTEFPNNEGDVCTAKFEKDGEMVIRRKTRRLLSPASDIHRPTRCSNTALSPEFPPI